MKKYTSPEIEIKAFAVEDIITASTPQGMDTNTSTPVADVDGSGDLTTGFEFPGDFK